MKRYTRTGTVTKDVREQFKARCYLYPERGGSTGQGIENRLDLFANKGPFQEGPLS